jgi:putative phosphoesterase
VRVAALSDIHGNLPALEAVLADVEQCGVDEIVVAGDTVSGPWPVEVFERLVEIGARCVHGNADREVLRGSERYGPLAPWCAERLGETRLQRVRSWPTTLELHVGGLGDVVVCHSTPTSDEPIYTRLTPADEVDALFGDVRADALVCGHTHMQYDRTLASGLRVVNPGSVGMPYEGRRGAFWALLGPAVAFRCTTYDVEEAVAAARATGAPLPDEFSHLLLVPADPEATAAEFEQLRGA